MTSFPSIISLLHPSSISSINFLLFFCYFFVVSPVIALINFSVTPNRTLKRILPENSDKASSQMSSCVSRPSIFHNILPKTQKTESACTHPCTAFCLYGSRFPMTIGYRRNIVHSLSYRSICTRKISQHTYWHTVSLLPYFPMKSKCVIYTPYSAQYFIGMDQDTATSNVL